MPILSGTLRFWTGDGEPSEVRLDRVEFAFSETWEPSLIVEDWYVAVVDGRRVRFGEYDGVARGLTLEVEGAEHAELVGWFRHVPGSEATEPGPDFVDGIVFDVSLG